MNILCVITYFIAVSFCFSAEDTTNPENYFGSQYSDALLKVKENKSIFIRLGADCNIDPQLAASVIFPEMLRYSLWKDFFETKALETLYVVKGSEAADFSIGWFQMKPSFAERIELEVKADSAAKAMFKGLLHYSSDSTHLIEIRRERILRLKNFKVQVQYLMAFVLFAEEKLNDSSISESERLTYLSALYNRGIDCRLSEIPAFANSKTFPYGPGRENPFSYSELTEYFYKHHSFEILK